MKRIKYKGYEHYAIDKEGNVWNIKYKNPKKIASYLGGTGMYPRVALYSNKKQKRFYIHRLLAEAYLPNPNNYPLVRHLNDIKTDNRLENLAWGNHRDNMLDYFKNRKN